MVEVRVEDQFARELMRALESNVNKPYTRCSAVVVVPTALGPAMAMPDLTEQVVELVVDDATQVLHV